MTTSPPEAEVLRLITRLNIGGPARQALLLTRSLAETHPTLLAAGRPAAHEGELTDPAVSVTRLPLVRPVRPAADVRSIVGARALLRQSGAKIVHTHMAKAGAVGRMAARSVAGTRTVHTFHGHVLEGYFGALTQRTFLGIERYLARHTDVLLAVSTEIRDALVDLGVGTPNQYEVVPLGLDLDRHLVAATADGRLRATLGLAADVPLIGVVGRLVPIKDHDTLFEAMQALPGVHLSVLGDGERRDELERRAAALGIADRTHFVGWWDDMPSALVDLDVVALSSRNEGTPVALIEALACARPVVASNVGGVASVVLDGRTGTLVPAGQPGALADALRWTLANERETTRRAADGRADVAERFGPTGLVRRISSLYDELLARRG